MVDRQNAEFVFLEHLGYIDRVVSIAARTHGLSREDAEDFAAWVRMELVDDDYGVLRRASDKVGIKTYVATVVMRMFVEHLRMRRGRWRPSAAAKRSGSVGVGLEMLVRRDGYTLAQAGERLRTARLTSLADAELTRLLAQFPEHYLHQASEPSPDPVLDSVEGLDRADERVKASEGEAFRENRIATLVRAMDHLTPEDQVIVRMHFADDRSVADVARMLGIEQKTLYRRISRLRDRLRDWMTRDGVTGGDVRELGKAEDI